MKSEKVEGSFLHQHCSNTHNRYHHGLIKPTLLFNKGSNKSLSAVPLHSGFSTLLEGGTCGIDLGPVDQHWFEKALHGDIGAREVQCKRPHENDTREVKSPSVEITETPARHRKANNQQRAKTPQQFSSPSSICTPEERHPVTQQTRKRHNEKQRSNILHHALRNGITPVKPSLIPITPNVEKFDTARGAPALLDTSPSPGKRYDQEEPSPCGWCPAQEQTTPTFMKQLFKTPSTVSKLDDFSFTTPGQFLSTPLRMSVSLGADLDDSNLSWTSSLATPQGATDEKTNTLSASRTDWAQGSTVVAKALFTSTIETPEHHTRQRRHTDTDSQASNLLLQSLHMSSTEDEEEMLEDTIRSDVADDNGREKEERMVEDANDKLKEDVEDTIQEEENVVKHADDDVRNEVGVKRNDEDCQSLSCDIAVHYVPGGEDIFAREDMKGEHRRRVGNKLQSTVGAVGDAADSSRRGDVNGDVNGDVKAAGAEMQVGERKHEENCYLFLAQNELNFAAEDTKAEHRIREDKEEVLISSHISSEPDDNTDHTTKDLHPSLMPAEVLKEDNLKSVTSVEAAKRAIKRVQTDSQRSMENLTPNDSCVLNISDLSSFDQSRMEDTLAFFFQTPPQTRSRLAKFKKQKHEMDKTVIRGASQVAKSDVEAGMPESTSLEVCSVAGIPTEIEEEPQGTEDLRPTKTSISIISVREEDGSLKEFVENVSEIIPSQSLCMNCTNSNSGEGLFSLQPEDEKYIVEISDTKSQEKADNTTNNLDKCEVDIQTGNNYSQKMSTQSPSSSNKAQQDTTGGLSPPASVRNFCSITPVRQMRTVASPPACGVKSPDIFSQISPNFADALCHITEQVSESHQVQSLLFPMPKDNKETCSRQRHLKDPSCDETVVSFKTPSVQLKSPPILNDSKHLSLINSQCNVKRATLPEAETQDALNNSKRSYEQETTSQLFRMQPKSSTTRKFFYPSTSTTAPKASGQTAMQWITEAVLVKIEEEQQQQEQLAQETLPELELNKSIGDDNKGPNPSGVSNSIYSSTPAPRNSAFVTFTNFMKTKRTNTSETSNAVQSTPAHHNNEQSPHKLMVSVKVPQQTTHTCSTSANSNSNLGVALNQTTPLSRRTAIPVNNASYNGARRRTGTQGLPAPKRLEVMMDEEHLGPDHSLNAIETRNTLARIPESRTTLNKGISRISASSVQRLQVESSGENNLHHDVKPTKGSGDGVQKVADFIIASTHCTTAKPNIAKQEPTTHIKQSLWKEGKEPDGAIPVSVSFASASGQPIRITETAMEKAKQLWLEDQREDIPVSVGFSSASGKAIHISNTALDKAKALFEEEDGQKKLLSKIVCKKNYEALGEKGSDTVPRKVGFTSASGKAIQISKSALQKAKLSFLEDEIRENLSSTSTGIVQDASFPKTGGFSSAGAKTIQVSESASRNAKLVQDEHQDTPLAFASAGAKRTLSAMGKPKMSSVENERQETASVSNESTNNCDMVDGFANQHLGKTEKIRSVCASDIPNTNSEYDAQKTKVVLAKDFQQDQMPSFSGFASASGKTISISETALKKAEKLFEEGENEIPSIVRFASAAGKLIELSESDLKKASTLLDESEDAFPASKKMNRQVPILQDEEKEESITSPVVSPRQCRFQQRHPKPQTNRQNLPKGFRPFKAPAKVHTYAMPKTPVKVITHVKHLKNSFSVETEASDKALLSVIGSRHLETIPETGVVALSPDVPIVTKMTVTESSEFEEEFMSASQARQEIEAAEETESAYAFMQAEDDGFSQFEELTVNNFMPSISSKSTGRPGVEDDAMTANNNAETFEDLDSTTNEIAYSGKSVVHSNLPSQVSSQASDALDRAFVQSQGSAIEEIEIDEPTLSIIHQEEEFSQFENRQNIPDINISAANAEAGVIMNSPKSSVHVVDFPLIEFQTTSGNKVSLSKEALQKVKMILDAGVSTECNKPSVSAAQKKVIFGNPEHETNKQVKTNPASTFSGFQTAGGKLVTVSEEALKRAKNIFSEDDIIESPVLPRKRIKQDAGVPGSQQQEAGNETEGAVNSFSVGFQTASGSKVSISEESLRRARHVFEEAEEKFNSQSSIISSITKTVGNPAMSLGFTSAGGSKVTISGDNKESLKQVKGLLDTSERLPSDDNPFTASINTRKGQPFLGFSTASGSKVTISEVALENAKKLFRENDDDTSPEHKRRRLDRVPHVATTAGFQTASGSSVSVSHESLQEAKRLFESTPCSNLIPKATAGFHTASGSKVTVSAESLANAQRFLAEDETDTDPRRDQGQPLLGFSTASGDRVPISQAALEKARRLFEEPGDDDNCRMPIILDKSTSKQDIERKRLYTRPNVSVPQGFQTACGSSVSISKTSLQKVKALLGNDRPQSCETGVSVPRINQEGFQQLDPVQRASALTVKQFRRNSSNAVVPQLGEKTNNDMPSCPHYHKTATGALKDRTSSHVDISVQQQGRSEQRFSAPFKPQRPFTSKNTPGRFQPPYQTSQCQTRQSRTKSAEPTDTSQVVPQMPIPLLPPKTRTLVSGARDNRQTVVQPNKRGLDSNSSSHCGSIPKRARVEDSFPGNPSESSLRGKCNNVLCLGGLNIGRWEQARRSQSARIHSKKTQDIKPQLGELFSKRQHGLRVPLYELVNGQPPLQYSRSELVEEGVLQTTLTMTSSSAEDFKFTLTDHFSSEALETSEGLLLGDGGRLVPDDAGMTGKQEFLNALLDTPGVDPKFVTTDWVNNHYRWIVWKLAAMERAYPQQLAGRYLTPNQVLLQLKYRYDREIDHTHRSVLKKILERDDAPSKRMVLCVAGIHQTEMNTDGLNQEGGKDNEKISSRPVLTLELTDGWYGIKAIIDKPLAGLVRAGKVAIGQKLCIYGAELVGSHDACSPLEVPASLRLKISANATRRARFDALLGLQRYPQPFPLPLVSLYPEGGTVGCVDVVVVRSYPLQFMEKHSEGGCTFRGRRAEEKEAERFAQKKQKEMERLYNKIQDEYQEKENKTVTSSRRSSSAQKLTATHVRTLHTGQEVYEALCSAMDPGAVEALLSERQMTLLNDYQRCLHEKKQTDLQGQFKQAMEDEKQVNHMQRNVTPLLRLRIADYHNKSGVDPETYQLTVWRPTDDVMQLLSEGKHLKIFNVGTSSGRFCVGSNNIQLSSTRATRYLVMPSPTHSSTSRAVYHPREVLNITHAHQPGYKPAYGEVDVVGVVVLIQEAINSPGKSSSQMVYLSDAQGILIAVKFWGGLQAHCLESLVKPGAFLASSSLQWRSNSIASRIPCLHASDTASVTQCPKTDHLRNALQGLQNQIKNPKGFAQSLEQLAMDMIVTQSRYPTPRTPRPDYGPVGMASAMPWSSLGPSGRPCATVEQSYQSDGGSGGSLTSDLPNLNQHSSSPTPANWTNQLRPHAASTPLPTKIPHAVVSTPDTRGQTVYPSPYGLVSTPVSDPQDKRRLDASRRFDLLSRVPSPPPLSPLPTPLSNRVTRGFRLPSCRRSIPQHGSTYGLNIHNTPGLKGLGLGVKRSNLYNRGQNRDVSDRESGIHRELSEDIKMATVNTAVKHREGPVVKELGKTCDAMVRSMTENSPEEDMTPSQRQVQEVLGMSYKSLGEIDWEWTQQMDPPSPPESGMVTTQCSQPSPDFSYDTPSQSSVKDGLCVVPPNVDSKKLILVDNKLNKGKSKENVIVSPAFGEDCRIESRGEKVSTSKRKLGRRFRRGKVGNHDTRMQESMTREAQSAVDDGGDHLQNEYQVPEQVKIKGRELQTDVDGDKDFLKDEHRAPKEETVTRQQETAVDRAKKHLKDAQVSKVEPVAEQQQSLQAAAGKRKRRARSRADLSILEQSSLLGDGSGESTRRVTRSASRHSAAGGVS